MWQFYFKHIVQVFILAYLLSIDSDMVNYLTPIPQSYMVSFVCYMGLKNVYFWYFAYVLQYQTYIFVFYTLFRIRNKHQMF